MKYTVAAAACPDYRQDRVRGALEEVLRDKLGWVCPGMTVALKLNLVSAHSPESAVTCHPVLVSELSKMLMERGAKVVLGDSPGGPFNRAFLEGVYRKTGIYAAARECGAELNTDFSTVTVDIPGAQALKSFTCTQYLLKADAIIDVCKLKTHALTAYTGACKNMFGGVAGMEKAQLHYVLPTHELFGSAMVDLCEFFAPRLSVCDGILALEGNGPTNGEPRKMGVLLASENPHALDLCAAHIIGLGPEDVPTIAAAQRRGLCPATVAEVDIQGDLSPFVVTDFKLQPKSAMRSWGLKNKFLTAAIHKILSSRPWPDQSCIGCGRCKDFCPAGAIAIEKGKAVIDRKKCINCFCCGEFCPVGAVKPKLNFIARLLGRQ